MFEFENMRYKDILFIDQLTIFEGEFTCIVGESGGGKTTLLRLLNKMISPTEGSIYFRNQPLEQCPSVAHRMDVSMLSQQPVMFDGTIKDNLLYAIRLFQKEAVSDEELNDLLQRLKVKKKLSDDASLCSGGEKQRIAFGRILLKKSTVLLLDEPSSALDEKTEDMLLQIVSQYAKEHHVSVILVTHSTEVALKYGQRMIRIESGRVVQ